MIDKSRDAGFRSPLRVRLRWLFEGAAFCVVAAGVAGSAIAVKEARSGLPPLVAVDIPAIHDLAPAAMAADVPGGGWESADFVEAAEPAPDLFADAAEAPAAAGAVRWFNGRPVRPARTIQMKVTGYSPDPRSCGPYADGRTATLHSVKTNGMALVAADPRVLPYGSMLTVPGYDDGNIVPVLDCGGAIKGNRLDLLFATHERARQWGVKTVAVTVWEYADGGKPEDPRRVR